MKASDTLLVICILVMFIGLAYFVPFYLTYLKWFGWMYSGGTFLLWLTAGYESNRKNWFA